MPSLASCRLLVFALVILVLAFPTAVRAQKAAGGIVGTVRAPPGALAGRGTVTVREGERGSNFSVRTNDAGKSVGGPLRVGRYTVTVEPPGFKKGVSEPINLDVQQ